MNLKSETMAMLWLELDILRIAKARNANMHTIMLCERDITERAKQVRARVYHFAFRALAQNRRKA